MRIAQISTLSARVRQNAGGSVEALVWLLTREMARLGHEVTVFGAEGSEVDGQLAATVPGPYGEDGSPGDWQLCEWINLCRALGQSEHFDVLHSHAYLWGLPLGALARAPFVHTLHIVPEEDSACLWNLFPNSCVTAISRHQWSAFPHLKPAAVIPHGVDLSQFTLRETPGDYVCYLGRFEPGKGPLQAIQAARALGLRLLLAGPPSAYYRERVQPQVDGRSVEYIGYVSGAERDRLLGGAKALLYPIQYPEPFGLVLVEAMLCGTPVAALNFGAIPEILEPGVSGYYTNSAEEFLQLISKCFDLDRRTIRRRAEERFSAERMAREYLRVYERLVSR